MSKGMRIKEIYAKVLEDDGLASSILEFSGGNQNLVHRGLAVGSELTVIAEVVRLYLTRGVPLNLVEPESYWKQMQ